MDGLLNVIGWFVVEVFLVGTGRLVIAIASAGRWRGERFGGVEGRTYGLAGALSFVQDGQRVVTRTGLLFAGGGSYIALVALLLVVAGS